MLQHELVHSSYDPWCGGEVVVAGEDAPGTNFGSPMKEVFLDRLVIVGCIYEDEVCGPICHLA